MEGGLQQQTIGVVVQGVAPVVLVVLSDLPLINLSSSQVQCTAKIISFVKSSVLS